MALDQNSASKHVNAAIKKGYIVKPHKERTLEDVEKAKAKAKASVAPKKPAAKKAPAKGKTK